MGKKKITTVSLELLKQQELEAAAKADETEDFSDLSAEEELDFNYVQEREYEPEVWEVENDDTTEPEDESV